MVATLLHCVASSGATVFKTYSNHSIQLHLFVHLVVHVQEAGSKEADQAAQEAANIATTLSSQLDAWDMRMLLGGQFDDKVRHEYPM